jgi:hypothetical protein
MRILPALALSGSLLLGACTNPDGSLNVPGTLALGAGAAIAGLAIASANDRPRHHGGYRGGYYGGGYRNGGYGYGSGRPAYYSSGYGYRQRGW